MLVDIEQTFAYADGAQNDPAALTRSGSWPTFYERTSNMHTTPLRAFLTTAFPS